MKFSAELKNFIKRNFSSYYDRTDGYRPHNYATYARPLISEWLKKNPDFSASKDMQSELGAAIMADQNLGQIDSRGGSHSTTHSLAFASISLPEKSKKNLTPILRSTFDLRKPMVVAYRPGGAVSQESECSSSARNVSTHLALFLDPDYRKAEPNSEKNLLDSVYNYRKYLTNLIHSTLYAPVKDVFQHDTENCSIASYYFPSTVEHTFQAIDILLELEKGKGPKSEWLVRTRQVLQRAAAWLIAEYLKPADLATGDRGKMKQSVFVVPLLTKALAYSFSKDQSEACQKVVNLDGGTDHN